MHLILQFLQFQRKIRKQEEKFGELGKDKGSNGRVGNNMLLKRHI